MFEIKKIMLGVAAAAALSACSMAPKYAQPQVETGHFPAVSGSLNPTGQVAATRLGWQDYFADARLQTLIALALENNRDLRVAALNVEAVRAQYAIARADRLPALGATGTGNKGRIAQDLSATGQSYITESYTAGLGITAFELDLFGRVKSLSDNALNQYFAQTQNRDAAQISLIATVAKAYFAERSAQERMDLAARVLKSREESKKLTDLKFKSGVISAIDVRVAETQIETARADYAVAEQARTQARTALALLIGQPLPDNLPAGASLDAQFVNAELPVGLPSEILYQRPDVRAAEFALKGANANIGAARAAFFPRITLTGSIGSGSTELSGLFTGGNSTWSFMPQISLPIFTWGQNKANLDLATVRKNIAVAQYEQTVQAAFKDVADALSARGTLQRQYQAQQNSARAQADRYRLVNMRFAHGISSSLELLDAERDSYGAQQALLATRQTLLENRADVYKVLGGGLQTQTVAQ
ncbi:efflux transporter outer membrane subunit [Paralysiella testudinis]|uniref:Efflux transporter outer membrane subunit n=1 Tax=Paralysiella testudinis TaxID=2809020 RepID=A0A892ZHK9_9NEIS|nr:efflux transporter outer membrane subunit [Paralysiella testudinis]QRQ83035.1 efflux transporter outer membrane subunit [Paralysiella testudinis]